MLTGLCLRSKAAWGYDEAFIAACRDELTLTCAIMRSSHLQVAETGGRLVGVAQLTVNEGLADLEKLFIEPFRLRSGVGSMLFAWAVATARALGAARLTIVADPNAAGFYRSMGAVDDGTVPSGSIPGRLLPRLTLRLSEDAP